MRLLSQLVVVMLVTRKFRLSFMDVPVLCDSGFRNITARIMHMFLMLQWFVNLQVLRFSVQTYGFDKVKFVASC